MAVSTVLAASCADKKDGPSEPTLAQRLDRLAGCTPTDLQVLLPWTGPAFDPASGRLAEPLPAGHVEAVAQGWRNYSKEATALRLEQGARVAEDVFTRPGLLGFQGVESESCDISISHTLWRDEASMRAFVTAAPHATAMASAGKMHHRVVAAHWTGSGPGPGAYLARGHRPADHRGPRPLAITLARGVKTFAAFAAFDCTATTGIGAGSFVLLGDFFHQELRYMNQTRARLIPATLLLGLSLTGAGACDQPINVDSDPEQRVSAVSTDPSILRVGFWGSADRLRRTRDAAALFTAQTGIPVELEHYIPTQGAVGVAYWPTMNQHAADHTLPDIMQHDYALHRGVDRPRAICPLDPYVADGTLNLSDVPPTLVDGGKVGGKLMGMSLGTNTQAVIIDLDAFEAAGIDVPADTWTWSDFERIALKLTSAWASSAPAEASRLHPGLEGGLPVQ